MKALEAFIVGFVIFAVLGVALAWSFDANVWLHIPGTGLAVAIAYAAATVCSLIAWGVRFDT